jgi:DNA-directed RNA polymerase subunit RPC12/RpoP
MGPLKTTCSLCSATIRYPEQLAGKKAKCPHCKSEILIPRVGVDSDADQIVLGGEDDEAPPRLAEKESNHCANCGKKIKPGIRRCKRCQAEAQSQLASRMKSEAAFDNAMATQSQLLATRRQRRRPSLLHMVIIALTLGTWYWWWYRSDDDDDE